MNRFTLFLISIISLFVFKPAFAENERLADVVYIANEGFLIEVKNHKILIDGLFGKKDFSYCHFPSDRLLNEIINASSPFNDIDLVLCSHVHRDHFNAEVMSEFLRHNPQCTLISTKQVQEKLKETEFYSEFSERVIAADYGDFKRSKFTINSIEIETLSLPHSWYAVTDSLGNTYNKHANIQNLGFYIEVDGLKMFHCGDASSMKETEYENYQLNSKKIDVAFLDRGFLRKTGQAITNKYIQSRYNIYMHIHPDRIQLMLNFTQKHHQLFVFEEQMQRQTFKY